MNGSKVVTGRMLQRIDSAENWKSVNPILLKGEIGWEDDSGLFKVGTGNKRWNDLPYKNFLDILKGDPTAESTHDQVVSAKSLFDILGGTTQDLFAFDKSIIPAINTVGDWVEFADYKLQDILYSYEGFSYQVGNFEPRFYGSTRVGNINYLERSGEYVVLGRIIGVVIHVRMTWVMADGPTGEIRLTDFPYVPDLAGVQSGLSARSTASEGALISITTPAYTRFQFTQSNGSLANLNWLTTGTNVEFTVSGLYGIKGGS